MNKEQPLQIKEDKEVILDKETSELYNLLSHKSRMVNANIDFFLNKLDKMDPLIRKKVAKEINDDLDALLQKMEKK